MPGTVAVDVAGSLAKELTGKVVVDCNNPPVWKEGPVWTPPAEGSLAAAFAKAAPGARVVKAFNTLGAEHHADPKLTGKSADVFMASADAHDDDDDDDDDDARKLADAGSSPTQEARRRRKLAGEVATRAGFTPIDFGPLRNAAVLDNVAMRWIHLATVGGHPRNFAFAM